MILPIDFFPLKRLLAIVLMLSFSQQVIAALEENQLVENQSVKSQLVENQLVENQLVESSAYKKAVHPSCQLRHLSQWYSYWHNEKSGKLAG